MKRKIVAVTTKAERHVFTLDGDYNGGKILDINPKIDGIPGVTTGAKETFSYIMKVFFEDTNSKVYVVIPFRNVAIVSYVECTKNEEQIVLEEV